MGILLDFRRLAASVSRLMSRSEIRFDPTDPAYEPLSKAAGRIAVLLDLANKRDDDFLRYTLDLLLGAIYALAMAHKLKYRHRTGPAEPDKPPLRARAVETGSLRMDGAWIAGFYFNSGILRVAAVYHRSLKIAVGRPTTKDHVRSNAPGRGLSEEARGKYPGWTDTNAAVIHDDVNVVKHDANGLVVRRAELQHATAAVDEILSLLERST